MFLNASGHIQYTGDYFRTLDWETSYVERRTLLFGSLPDTPLLEPSSKATFNCSKNHNEGVFCYYMPSSYYVVLFRVKARGSSEMVTEWSRAIRIHPDTTDHRLSINHKFLLVDAMMINNGNMCLSYHSHEGKIRVLVQSWTEI